MPIKLTPSERHRKLCTRYPIKKVTWDSEHIAVLASYCFNSKLIKNIPTLVLAAAQKRCQS